MSSPKGEQFSSLAISIRCFNANDPSSKTKESSPMTCYRIPISIINGLLRPSETNFEGLFMLSHLRKRLLIFFSTVPKRSEVHPSQCLVHLKQRHTSRQTNKAAIFVVFGDASIPPEARTLQQSIAKRRRQIHGHAKRQYQLVSLRIRFIVSQALQSLRADHRLCGEVNAFYLSILHYQFQAIAK